MILGILLWTRIVAIITADPPSPGAKVGRNTRTNSSAILIKFCYAISPGCVSEVLLFLAFLNYLLLTDVPRSPFSLLADVI